MRILVADDEVLLVEYLDRSLKKAGHDVDRANNGAQALNRIYSKNYDVIILDIVMPQINGINVCTETRARGINTPIIILSSLDAEESRVKGLDAGADDYLIKPFSFPELEARLRALHRRPLPIIGDILRVGDLIIDTRKQTVTYFGTEIELRNKEFKLLEYLARNAERTVSRQELFEHVWGIQAENSSNRVDACVKQLRSRIDFELVRTVHRSGYKIVNS